MSNDAFDIINSIIFCHDLLECGQKIINFSDSVYKMKNRITVINYFYEQLYHWAFGHYLFKNEDIGDYIICDDKYVVNMFLALRIPKKKSTVKTIKEIKSFGEFILSNYKKPVGKCITERSLKDILQYLEKEYLYCTKIFSNNGAYFIRLHNTHKNCNSECTIAKKDNKIVNYFLYHMIKKKSITPEAGLFHELGHAIHIKAYGDVNIIPNEIIDILKDIGFPKIKELDINTQSEIFADVLGVGLMYNSPFSIYDVYNEIEMRVKELYNKFALLLFNNIKSEESQKNNNSASA